MQCREAREFFSPYLDGELLAEEITTLEQHLGECPDCREELARWEELARALRGLQAPVTAPAGFAAAINARLAARQKMRPWQGARRWIATAAAVAILAAGSIGYAARGLWQPILSPVALLQPHDGQQPGGSDGSGVPGAGVQPPDGQRPDVQQPEINQPPAGNPPPANGDNTPPPGDGRQPGSGGPGDQPPPPVNPPGNDGQDTTTPDNSRPAPPDNDKPGQQPLQIAGAEPYTPRTFLSNGHQATSTLLKVTVSDMVAARAKATGLAASSAATVQIVADQENGDPQRVIYQMVVAADRAAGLLNTLSWLGRVTDRNTSTQDLSQQFSTTLEQYQAKVAQVNAASDPAEKEKLLQDAKALEQQLATWEQETQQQTIILWLETK